MKVYCISLPERIDLREQHKEIESFFGDNFNFYIKDKNIRNLEDIHSLIKSGQVSFSFEGGRKKFSALIGEFDAWTKHFEIWETITEPSIIYEDGTIFDIEKFKMNDFKNYDLVFCDNDWKFEIDNSGNKILTGHNANYYVTPNGAKHLIKICKNLPIPMDLHIRNCMNVPDTSINFSIANPTFITRNPNVKHSIQESFDISNVNEKQCFRPLYERLYSIKKPKLAIIASHPSLGTGYANIATQIANNMIKFFDVIYLGFQSMSGKVTNRYVNESIRVYDLYKQDPESPMGFGDKAILPILDKEKPDIVMIYNDIGVISAVLSIIKSYSCTKTVYLDMVYEFQNFDQVKNVIDNSDYIFTFCDFWKQYLQIIYSNIDLSNKVHVMYHGLKKFEQKDLGSKKELGYPEDSFIVLNMNRNSNRKNIDITIRSFLIFLKHLIDNGDDVSNIFLQLNCHLCTKDGIHIPNVITSEIVRLGLSSDVTKNILISKNGHALSEEETHSLYNISDVGISTSSGEGFGLTPIEHAQYDKQIIVCKIPTFSELLDTPYVIEPIDSCYDSGPIGGLMYKFKAEDISKQLLLAYKNRNEPKICKIKNQDKLNWESICKLFYNIVI